MNRIALCMACVGLLAGCPGSSDDPDSAGDGGAGGISGSDGAVKAGVDAGKDECDPGACKETQPVPRCGPLPRCTKEGTGVCHWVVAHCVDPQPAPVLCGSKTCAAGLVCCNASCGICAPPDGACTQMFCEPKESDAGTAPGACKVDSDCRLFDDYCTGCDCRALSKSAPDPTCSGPGVRCLRAPCQGEMAACENGKCVVRRPLLTRDQ